jgi:hypothetical protein
LVVADAVYMFEVHPADMVATVKDRRSFGGLWYVMRCVDSRFDYYYAVD